MTRAVAVSCLTLIPGLVCWEGASEEVLRSLARGTARASFVFFAAAFFASSLKRLFPHPATNWLADHRPELGLSFACIHASHAAVIGGLAILGAPLGVRPFSVGWLALAMVALMAVTSNDASRRLLGGAWSRLHRAGGYLIAYVFGLSLAPAAGESVVAFALLSALMVGLGCRLTVFLMERIPRLREAGGAG